MLDQSKYLTKATLKVRKDDLYETPPCAVEALLRVEKIDGPIWEPACGPGAIVDVLRGHGYDVCATDLLGYGCGNPRIDFLMQRQCWNGTILTNPPYKLAAAFVRHAITLAPNVVMLMRLAFLEGVSRGDLIDKLSRVHVFSRRLPMMHRGGRFYEGKVATSAIPFAWFVWDKSHAGPTTVSRIDWKVP